MPRQKGVGGRPSKGQRHVITCRVPESEADELFARADALGVSLSEYLASVLHEHLLTTPAPPEAPAALLSYGEEVRLNRSA